MNESNPHPTLSSNSIIRPPSPIRTLCLGTVALVLSFTSAQAQFIRFRAGSHRVTVPINSGNTTVVTNQVRLSGMSGGGATLSFSGLPSGASASVDINPAPTNNTPINVTFNTTNVAQGEYTVLLIGTGLDTNSLPVSNVWAYILQSGHIWNGTTNAVNDGPSSWTDSSKWLGGVAGAGDDVIINDLGGQTNYVQIVPSTSTNPLVSITLPGDTTIGSIRFAPTNGPTRFHTIQINPGNTLSLTGTKGFSFARDYISEIQGIGNAPVLVFTGGGNLVVSNPAANFSLLIDNQLQFTNDMAGLANFSATVNRFALGDYTAWPNFFNYNDDNAIGGIPRRFLPNVYFAKTNVLKASYVDPNNYTNADDRHFALSFLNSEIAGTTTQPFLHLGISNIFLMDAVNFTGGNQQGNLKFNVAFSNQNPIAIFRSTNGGRMSLWSASDAGGTNGENTNVKGNYDFASTGGTVDILANRFYIGRDRKLIVGGQNPNYQGFFFMGKGLIDVNTMTLGFQEYTGQTNTATFNGYCEGVLTATNSGAGTNLIRINGNLTLGYSTQTNPLGLGSGGNTIYGKVFLSGSNTTMMVSNILVGNPMHTSANNILGVTNFASLIVSNSIGSAAQSLDSFTSDNSFVTLHLDLNRTTPYIFTTNLTTLNSNVIRIASIKNLGSLSGNIPLIQYSSGNGSFQGLIMPAGLGGALITTNNVGIYLNVLTNAPKDLIWRGYSSQDWDLTTANWFDRATGLHTNFSNGDRLTFDDGTAATTVHVVGPVDLVPGNIAMSNTVHYTFDNGGGDIQGSATLAEWGAGGVQIDGSTTLTVQLNAGSLTGSGAIGHADVAAGTTVNYSGSIGAGLSISGTVTLSGNSSGTLSVTGTGIFTNAGTYNGPFNSAAGALLVNNNTWMNGGNSIVVSNSTLINNGAFHASTLTIRGTLKDTGAGGIYMNGDVVNGTQGLTIANGGIFIPGGDGIGTTTVYPELGSVNNFPGRVLFSTGSTNVFKVNPGAPANTLLGSATMGFGPNQNTKQLNGGTILITNTSLSAFSNGQTFTMFQYYQGGVLGDAGLNTTNSYPVMSPQSPGPGLVWDLSNLIPNGAIGVKSVSTTPIAPTFSLDRMFGLVLTNTAATNSFTTNNYVITHLTWPVDHLGWYLQNQVDGLNEGLSTNWSTVFGSWWTNEMYFTNIMTTNCSFYRMYLPQ